MSLQATTYKIYSLFSTSSHHLQTLLTVYHFKPPPTKFTHCLPLQTTTYKIYSFFRHSKPPPTKFTHSLPLQATTYKIYSLFASSSHHLQNLLTVCHFKPNLQILLTICLFKQSPTKFTHCHFRPPPTLFTHCLPLQATIYKICSLFAASSHHLQNLLTVCHRGARWLSGRVSDSGARGRGFDTYGRRVVCCVLEQDTLLPESTG